MNIFEQATRKNYTFTSAVGELNVINLWELPLTSVRGASLDAVAKSINTQLKAEQEESFVATSTNTRKVELENKLEIVKHIIAVKLQENAAHLEGVNNKKRKAHLVELLGRKQDQATEAKSIEQIQAEIAALD
jgi:precorrin-2 methylase